MSLKTKFKNLSISNKINFWYSSFLLVFIFSFFIFSFFVSKEMMMVSQENQLISRVSNIASGQGIMLDTSSKYYIGIYTKKNEVLYGKQPKDFDTSIKLQDGHLGVYKKYMYYDQFYKYSGIDYWVRGVVKINDKNEFFYLALILDLFLLFVFAIIVYSGKKITEMCLLPIKKTSEIANEIKNSNDFSTRIPVPEPKDELYEMVNTLNSMLVSLEKKYNFEKDMASYVSHELRTPISVILTESEYAYKYTDTLEETKESLDVIFSQSKKMCNLINKIMVLSKLEAGKIIELEDVNLSEIVENYEFIDQRIQIKAEPNIYIHSNPILMQIVVNNLIHNAIKFSKDLITINLSKEGNVVKLVVYDDGPGVPEGKEEEIFNKYYTTNIKDGLGLGLYLVKRIVDFQCGTIKVKGGVFTVTFSNTLNK